MEKPTLSYQACKNISKYMLNNKYGYQSIYKWHTGERKGMPPIVQEAIRLYSTTVVAADSVATLTHATLMQNMYDLFAKYGQDPNAQVIDADDEAMSQENPLTTAWEHTDISTSQAVMNNRNQQALSGFNRRAVA